MTKIVIKTALGVLGMLAMFGFVLPFLFSAASTEAVLLGLGLIVVILCVLSVWLYGVLTKDMVDR